MPIDQIKSSLEKIKQVNGVENAVLTQRDGNPIQSSGVWLSKDEVFNISSATSAIYNLGLHLHPDELKYILLEGKSSKIFLAPLKNSMDDPIDRIMLRQGIQNNNEEFFIAITATPKVNLGGIFLQTRESLREIKRTLVLTGESFKPPLRRYNEEQINNLLNSFNTKENTKQTHMINMSSFSFSDSTLKKIDLSYQKLSVSVIDMLRTSLTVSGGFLVSTYLKEGNFSELDFEHEAAMSYSLYSTANRCAWLLKKMKVESILLECQHYYQFITPLGDGVFTLTVQKGRQKLGLLRLILPRFLTVLNNVVKEAQVIDNPIKSFQLKDVIGEITFNR
jgi:predicted regulator of Ras-like GTPase activity (Roadblock/LC7/MglB family)